MSPTEYSLARGISRPAPAQSTTRGAGDERLTPIAQQSGLHRRTAADIEAKRPAVPTPGCGAPVGLESREGGRTCASRSEDRIAEQGFSKCGREPERGVLMTVETEIKWRRRYSAAAAEDRAACNRRDRPFHPFRICVSGIPGFRGEAGRRYGVKGTGNSGQAARIPAITPAAMRFLIFTLTLVAANPVQIVSAGAIRIWLTPLRQRNWRHDGQYAAAGKSGIRRSTSPPFETRKRRGACG